MSEEPTTSLRIDQPFKCGYARIIWLKKAKCRVCQNEIQKNELRLAKMVKFFKFDGFSPHWYHFDCFFEKNKPKSTYYLDNFSTLRYEDQKKIESKIGKVVSQACDPSDFVIGYAKSGKASCILCEDKIPFEELRIAKYEEESDEAQKAGKPIPRWLHIDCFVSCRQEIGFFESAEKLPGFEVLEEQNQSMLKERIPKMDAKLEAENKSDLKVETKKSESEVLFENKLKEQSEFIYSFIDQIVEMHEEDVAYLLLYNGYQFPKDRNTRIEQLADAMAFGTLEKCPECKNGQLYFKNAGFICYGMVSNELKCTYEIRKPPKRRPFRVPDELKEKYDWLDKYKYEPRKQIIPKVQGPVDAENASSHFIDPDKPLSGHKIVIFGKLNLSSKEIEKVITDLGGKVVPNFERTVLFGITSQNVADEDSDKVDLARQYNIVLVDDNVVEDLKSNNEIEDIPSIISKHAICNWGVSEVEKRFATLIDKDKVKSFKSGSGIGNLKSKSTVFPDKQNLIIEDGTAVDPQSGLKEITVVYREGELIYSETLNRVDFYKNQNSYYKLQLLKEKSTSCYWVFTAWGRIGTNVGSRKLYKYQSLDEAKERFLTVFRKKTDNDWLNRDNFVRKHDRYFLLEIDYAGGDDDQKQVKMEIEKSELPSALRKLIMMLFDINLMQKEMKEFELDMTMMPLGNLSSDQIKYAYKALQEISLCLRASQTVQEISQYLDLYKASQEIDQWSDLYKASQGNSQWFDLYIALQEISKDLDARKVLQEITQCIDVCEALQENSKCFDTCEVLQEISQCLDAYKVLQENDECDACEALQEIRQCLKNNSGKAEKKLVAQTERFFTLIPHSFGTDKPPVFSSSEQVEQKREMLDALMGMKAAYNMIVAVEQTDDPIEQHYMNLNADLDVVDTKEPDYEMIKKYVTNTHSTEHNRFKLKILDVFRVSRHGEKERYEEKYAKLHNKMLLWHGSRITNFANILAQGLRIAPPEAPATGYMFGKGIYFADMVSKSANYCHADKINNIGLLALNEVALGDMWEVKCATPVNEFDLPYNSVKGLGKRFPNHSEKKFEGDIIVPSGKIAKNRKNNLKHNEYIIYDTAQTRIRFLVMVEFIYNEQ